MLRNSTINLYKIAGPFLSRAGNVGIFLADANIPFKEHHISRAEWLAARKQFQTTAVKHAGHNSSLPSVRNPFGSTPTIEVNGQWYAHTTPILRLIARELGRYDGKSNEEKYLVDAVADITADWRAAWIDMLFSKDRYIQKSRPRFVDACQAYVQSRGGPYLLGDRISYADILMYGVIYDETPALCQIGEHTPLHQLYRAVGERPRIKAYIERWEATKPSCAEYGVVPK
ncbi:hypothetical protein SYNPS1DRAFT_12171 [Syncephalis pseudoplumigaleata]|uniref:Glutathione S-transferase n=1 Tax=Syncephalis pseudoplumigaleata TaxID=1712513 RepID=A0A4P9Z7S7_9FUNG|nr:hypothetical protein SYNPS1DRAFT_12171 [Syncephalis pseudoplumigaleata]|eukprot:RKP27780.1 hypothetical protein SYNPS1DRAFT_12171 [Syncephalis pseudoplumigaleata]